MTNADYEAYKSTLTNRYADGKIGRTKFRRLLAKLEEWELMG